MKEEWREECSDERLGWSQIEALEQKAHQFQKKEAEHLQDLFDNRFKQHTSCRSFPTNTTLSKRRYMQTSSIKNQQKKTTQSKNKSIV
jgi:hypothetical protein